MNDSWLKLNPDEFGFGFNLCPSFVFCLDSSSILSFPLNNAQFFLFLQGKQFSAVYTWNCCWLNCNNNLCAYKIPVQSTGINILRDIFRLFFHSTSSILVLIYWSILLYWQNIFLSIKVCIKSRLLTGDGVFSKVMEWKGNSYNFMVQTILYFALAAPVHKNNVFIMICLSQ